MCKKKITFPYLLSKRFNKIIEQADVLAVENYARRPNCRDEGRAGNYDCGDVYVESIHKWLRGWDSNPRSSGYEPDDLPLVHPAINKVTIHCLVCL